MTRRRKPAGTSKEQGTPKTNVVQLVPRDGKRRRPPIPRGLSAKSKSRWAAFWDSRLADYVDLDADLHRLERWIADVDEFDRLRRAYEKSPTVEGSAGQPRLNPLASRLSALERQIRDAEDQFGMTPAARLKLGITFAGSGPATASDLNAMIEEGRDERDGDEAEAAGFVEA